MKTRELFELASLDVLGLLDEAEREAFELAFRKADPAVQAQVRREQLRFTEMEQILPEVQAPAGLKARVMAAVRDAIAAVRTEPIARIGVGQHAVFNAAPIWRAACIGFATAALVLGGFFYQVTQSNKQIIASLDSNALNEQMRRLSESGVNWRSTLMAKGLTKVDFSPTAADVGDGLSEPVGRIFIDPTKMEAIVLLEHLPIVSGEYTLKIIGHDKDRLKRFEATPGLVQIPLKAFDLSKLKGFEILAPAASTESEAPTILRATTL